MHSTADETCQEHVWITPNSKEKYNIDGNIFVWMNELKEIMNILHKENKVWKNIKMPVLQICFIIVLQIYILNIVLQYLDNRE